MKKLKLLIIALLIPFSISVIAQEEEKTFAPSFNWSGFTHLWTGYVQRDSLDGHYGFAVRYLRFKAYGNLSENVKWAAQFGFDKGNPALMDIFLSYEPLDYLKVRFGQFAVPGAKSGVLSSPLWSTTKMVLNDRATITQNWTANAGLKGYRSGGLMLYGSFLDKRINYFLMAAMPQAGPNYYFNPSVKYPTYANDENGTAMFSRLEIKPIEQIEFGVNYHTGKGSTVDTSMNRSSYSFYFLMRQKKLYAMAEFIGGMSEKLIKDIKQSENIYFGYYGELAYKMADKYEPAIRYDKYVPNNSIADTDGYKSYDNITLGFNYYPTKNIAIMANYVIRLENPEPGFSEIKNDLIYFQLRYKFASKK